MRQKHSGISPKLIIVLLIVSLAIIAFGGNLGTVTWGIGMADILPTPYYVIWLILTAALIIWLILKTEEMSLEAKCRSFLWDDTNPLWRYLFLFALLAIFVIFRFEAHLYGNGYLRISNIAQRTKPVFRWFEYGGAVVPYIFYQVTRLLFETKEIAAAWAYQIVSFLSGFSFLYIVMKIARLIFNDNYRRSIFMAIILFSGLSLFFFGMVENFSLLFPCAAFIVYAALKLQKDGKPKWLLILWGTFFLGIVVHIQFMAVLPASIYATIAALKKKRNGFVLPAAIAGLSSVVIIVAALYILAEKHIALENALLYLGGKPPERGYSLFCGRHFLDLLNLFFIMSPLFLILLSANIISVQSAKIDAVNATLRSIAAPQLVGLFILDPKNGMARDIPYFGFLTFGFILLGAYSIARYFSPENRLPQASKMATSVGLLLFFPNLVVHLSPEKTVASLDRFLKYNETKYESALLAMRDYYYISKNFSEADRREQSIITKAKGALESQLVGDLYAQERYDDAFAYARRLIEYNPYNATYRMQYGNMLRHFKKYEEAQKEYEAAVALEPYRVELYHHFANMYRQAGLENRRYEILAAAREIDPQDPLILCDLAGYFYFSGAYDSAGALADLALRADPERAYAYLVKGMIAEKYRRYDEALKFYYKFVSYGERLPEITFVRKRINEIELQLRDAPSER
jgi:tetratricopeptide (TPR) repeat protein